MFYIKKLRITGPGVKAAEVEFKKGLNIVHGPSNTGKSYILECIDYILAGKETSFDEKTGYNKIMLELIHNGSSVKISREIGKNKFDVVSGDSDISSGEYSLGKKNHINDVLLKLVDIEGEPIAIKNGDYDFNRLTLRTFIHMFLIREESILKKASILLADQATQQTSNKSALLYLLTGDDLKDEAEKEKPEVKKTRNEAIKSYIDKQLALIGEKKLSMQEYTGPSSEELRQNIDDLLMKIADAENELGKLINNSKANTVAIYENSEKQAESTMLLARYEKLQKHYAADIKRLSFIAEGNANKLKLAKVDSCPFCGGNLEPKEQDVFIDSIKAESEDIVVRANGLSDAISSVEKDIQELKAEEASLQAQRAVLEKRINAELQPEIDSLKNMLASYRISLERAKEHEMILAGEKMLKDDKLSLDVAEEDGNKYKPSDKFGKDFFTNMGEMMDSIFKECEFDTYGVLEFEPSTFDVTIDGKAKKKYGKGYRGFMNTMLAVGIQKYLKENGQYTPGILIIDSPILNLSEKEDVKEPEKKKKALFNYMMQQDYNEQTIILENDIPDIDYSSANMIEFTKDENDGRYGLLDIVE